MGAVDGGNPIHTPSNAGGYPVDATAGVGLGRGGGTLTPVPSGLRTVAVPQSQLTPHDPPFIPLTVTGLQAMGTLGGPKPLKQVPNSFVQSCIRRVDLLLAPQQAEEQDVPACTRVPVVVPLACVFGSLDELVEEPRTMLTLKEIDNLFVTDGHSATKRIRKRWNHGLRVLDKQSKADWFARLRLEAMTREHKEKGARGIAKAVLAKSAAAQGAAHQEHPRRASTCSWRHLPLAPLK